MTPLRIWNFPELPAFVSRQLPPAVLPPGRYQMPLPQSCHVAVTVNACPVRFLRTVPDPIAGRNSAKPPHQNRSNTPKAETPQSPRIRTGATHQRPKLRTSHQIMRDDRRTRREPGQDYAANAAGDAVRSVFCPDAPERLEGDVPVRRDQPRHVGKLGMRFKIFCRDRPQHPVVRGHGIIPPFA